MKDGKNESLIEIEAVVPEEEREAFLAKLNAFIDELKRKHDLRNITVWHAPTDEAEAGSRASVRVWPIL